jgi:hypothetical protein
MNTFEQLIECCKKCCDKQRTHEKSVEPLVSSVIMWDCLIVQLEAKKHFESPQNLCCKSMNFTIRLWQSHMLYLCEQEFAPKDLKNEIIMSFL